jgi:hypothetical protein
MTLSWASTGSTQAWHSHYTLGGIHGAAAVTPPRGALLDELPGIRVELCFSAFRAEVVRLTVELAAARCLRRIYLHAAHDVFFHIGSPSERSET